MSYESYKVIHLLGLMFLFVGFGILIAGFAMKESFPKKMRSLGFATHGIGMLFLLVGGFGLLAKLGMISGLPGWAWAKLVIWLAMGGAIALIKRKSELAPMLLVLLVGLGGLAATLAIAKPF